jgi:hypothetical protein
MLEALPGKLVTLWLLNTVFSVELFNLLAYGFHWFMRLWFTGIIEQHFGGDGTICTGSIPCKIYTGSGNCRLSWCNNEDYEVCRPLSETKQRALAIAKEWDLQHAGGFQSYGEPAPWTEVAMRATLAALRASDPNNRIALVEESNMKIISIKENGREVKVIEDATAALHIASEQALAGQRW